MTESELEPAGYRKYDSPGPWTNANRFYQKAIRDAHTPAKLYFINVGVWHHAKWAGHSPGMAPFGYEAEVHFYRDEDRSFRVCMPIREADTIADVEAEFAAMYAALGFVPDVHNN